MKEYSEKKAKDLCAFLKLLQECKNRPFSSLTILAREFEIPYRSVMIHVMCKKGILKRVSGTQCVWDCTTDPNIHMSEALLRECLNHLNNIKQNKQKPLWDLDHSQIGSYH